MGISYSGLNSFTPTPSYLAAADGSPMSMTFHPFSKNSYPYPQGTTLLLPSPLIRRCRRKLADLICGITTLSPQPGAANLPRLRPQGPYREETAHTPSPFKGIVPTSLSRPQPSPGLIPHLYRSRGRGSSGHTRSRSVGAQAHQGRPRPRLTRSLGWLRQPHLTVDGHPDPMSNPCRPKTTSGRPRGLLPEDFRYSIGHCPIVITNTTVHRFSILVLGEVCDNCLTSLR